MNTIKVLSNCSMKVTPAVLNMLTGLEQNDIKIGEMAIKSDSTYNANSDTIVKILYTSGIKGNAIF